MRGFTGNAEQQDQLVIAVPALKLVLDNFQPPTSDALLSAKLTILPTLPIPVGHRCLN